MIPIIAIIGHSNVGKSTLFNKLTNTNDALVNNLPGFTRDRKYGYVNIVGQRFICVDTGSIDSMKKRPENHIVNQSLIAIEESDIVLFVIDACTGLLPIDLLIAKYLRTYKKLKFLVVNKIDCTNTQHKIINFQLLGLGNAYPIVALRGIGISNLLKIIFSSFNKKEQIPKKTKKISKSTIEKNSNIYNIPIIVAIIGRPNVGKSTLINRILGSERVIVHHNPGTTRDSIHVPIKLNKRKYVFIDTAGICRIKKSANINFIEKFSVAKTIKAIQEANVALLVLDAQEGILDQDLFILKSILSRGCSLIIIVNKWDCLNKVTKKNFRKVIQYRLSFIKFVRVHYVSALYNIGINDIFDSVIETYNSSIRRINTANLTRIMNLAVKNYQLPLLNGRRVKLKYAHTGGYNPLLIVIHGTQVKKITVSYKHYLLNYFYKSLNIIGTPILLQFKENKNPYLGKSKNKTVKF